MNDIWLNIAIIGVVLIFAGMATTTAADRRINRLAFPLVALGGVVSCVGSVMLGG